MLTCVYHPIDPRQIVEEEEAARLIASGVWFDSPTKAKAYRAKVEEEIKTESKVKEQDNERQQNGAKQQPVRKGRAKQDEKQNG